MKNLTGKFLCLLLLSTGSAFAQIDWTTVEGWTDGTFGDTCGAPGEKVCSQGCARGVSGLQGRSDPYTRFVNCDLDIPVCPARPPVQSPLNFTFLFTSDLHLRNGFSIPDFDHVLHVEAMNSVLTNQVHWPSVAGYSNKDRMLPEALVIGGDMTDDGQDTHLGAYRLLYEQGLVSDGTRYPVYPGLGNHDVQNDCYRGNCAYRMFDYIPAAAGCLAKSMDTPGSNNYSWDWGNVHALQLNSWAGDTVLGSNSNTGTKYTHDSGIPWLISDLIANVGTSGRPVIIFQHFGWDSKSMELNADGTAAWWSDADRALFLSIIKDYNVIGIFSGHRHISGMHSAAVTDSHGNNKIIDNFTNGTGGIADTGFPEGFGQFMTVRLTSQFLDVQPMQWDPGTDLHLGSLYPTHLGKSDNEMFYNKQDGCRKWIGPPLHGVPAQLTWNATQTSITITNTSGVTMIGPFAVETTADSRNTYIVDFVGSCSKGPVYKMIPDLTLAPNQTVTMAVDPSFAGSLRLVTMGTNDWFNASSTAFTLMPGTPQNLEIATEFSAHKSFTANSNRPWLKATPNISTTPATIQLSVNIPAWDGNGTGRITILPDDPSYPPLNVSVALVPTTYTLSSNITGPLMIDDRDVLPPQTVQWTPGSKHTIDAPDYLPGNGTKAYFSQWTDAPSAPQKRIVTAGLVGANLVAYYKQYAQVTTAVSPAGAGSVGISPSSADSFYQLQTEVTLNASANPGYQFNGYSGDATDTRPKTTLHVTKPVNAVANFVGAGTITLSASANVASVVSVGTTQGRVTLNVGLTNAGPGVAVGAEITGIDGFTVLSGTGTVSTMAIVPFPANLAVGQTEKNVILLNWPDSAKRVQFTVHFKANATYTGSTTLTVDRD